MTAPPLVLHEGLTPDPRFPDQLLNATAEHGGVRYIEIGDEGDWLVMLGHPETAQALAAIRHEGYYEFLGDDLVITHLTCTWARLLLACPNHAQKTKDCRFCEAEVSPAQWWLDWDGGESKQDAPGWFPVTVWEVNA